MFQLFRQDEPDGPAGPGGPAGEAEQWLAELLADQGEEEPEEDRSLYCFVCGEVVTREERRLSIRGAHRHTFTNPGGYVYEIGCFAEAEGCGETGEPTEEHTWFPGYAWRYAYCGSCRVHLGWVYEAVREATAGSAAGESPAGGPSVAESPARFFGLILNRLVAGRQNLASRS